MSVQKTHFEFTGAYAVRLLLLSLICVTSQLISIALGAYLTYRSGLWHSWESTKKDLWTSPYLYPAPLGQVAMALAGAMWLSLTRKAAALASDQWVLRLVSSWFKAFLASLPVFLAFAAFADMAEPAHGQLFVFSIMVYVLIWPGLLIGPAISSAIIFAGRHWLFRPETRA